MRPFWCVGLVVLLAPVVASAQNFCNELARLQRENAQLSRQYNDPAHGAAMRNYQNAHTAYCGPSATPSFPRGGGGGAGNMAAFGGAMLGILGMMMPPSGGGDDEDQPMSREEIRREEERLARLRAEADRELAERQRREAERQRRCAMDNPFGGGGGSGCAPAAAAANPFGRGPYWDSVTRRDCTTITFGTNGCMPDSTRAMLAEAARDPTRRAPGAHRPARGENYAPHVLTVEDFRRLGAGERFETVVTSGMEARVLRDLDERMSRATGQSRR